MRYDEFDLWIEPQRDDYYPLRARFRSPRDANSKLTISSFNALCQQTAELRTNVDEPSLKKVGGLLFDTLFSGEIAKLYQNASKQLSENAGMRIRFRVAAPEVKELPWELIYDSARDCFLSTSSQTPLTWLVDLEKSIDELGTSPPIRILVIVPNSSEASTQWRLKMASNLDKLGDGIEIKILDTHTSLANINRELVLKQFHIIHFLGESAFVSKNACLLLDDERGQDQCAVTAKEFSYFFRDYACLKLIVLQSSSSHVKTSPSLRCVAEELVQLGIPAAIATRGKIGDEGAKIFSQNLYLKLCLGYERGRVDLAVSHARKRLIAELANSPEFAYPILFMRSPQGVIFDLDGPAITTGAELDTLKAVAQTHDYNISQLEKKGDSEAAAKEIKAQSGVRARLAKFYRKVAISVAPRVVAMGVVLSLLVFIASHTKLLSPLRIDDYLSGAMRLWADRPEGTLNPNVRLIIAEQDGNDHLGSVSTGSNWRQYHTNLVNALTLVSKKPKVIVFDLDFYNPAGDLDVQFAKAMRSAQNAQVRIVGGQHIDNNGQQIRSFMFTPEIGNAIGDSWGDLEVGGKLDLPLLKKIVFINEYEIASLAPGTPIPTPEIEVVPSIALRAVMQLFEASGRQVRSYFNEDRSEVIVRASNGMIEKQIPVTRKGLSLDMLMYYAPKQSLQNNSSKYADVHKWATSAADPSSQLQLERLFENSIVVIGYNTDRDRQTIIGDEQRSGVEVHANAISNVLNDEYFFQISRGTNFAVILFMMALGILLQTVLKRWLPGDFELKRIPYLKDYVGELKVPISFLVGVVLYLLIAYLAYSRSRVSLDIAYHLAALLFGYLLITIFRKRMNLTGTEGGNSQCSPTTG